VTDDATEEREALAALKILIAVAKVDGVLRESERHAIEDALDGVKLPDGVTLDALVATPIALEEEIAAIRSKTVRTETYWAAVSLANVDGQYSKEEKRILLRLRDAFDIDSSQPGLLDELVEEAKDTFLPTHIEPVLDVTARGHEIRRDMIKYAVMSGVFGAFPIPGLAVASDLAVVTLQTKLVRDIGQYYGHTIDKEAATSLIAGVAGATGMRIAVSNLMKLVPGWGTVVGATSAFAATYAIGHVARRYFEGGMKVPSDELRAEFKTARRQGEAAFRESASDVAAAAAAHDSALRALHAELKAGTISRKEYERRVQALAAR